ncbi:MULTISPECIES: AsmA family protein [unclassified Methylobacterium]|uniref:AsmA family protein n=1 Tax=unclassified Methylobacterium TaxID=2615210 RepID=UPI0011CA9071|nr:MULTISPECIES: AsmA family protein [unclassified Methylobacterium]TXM66644.1 AsmA family protein [Methylobacterium sp. WL120]TXN84272.1 AsmA family protein [Methylobacterium sp. WL8]
MSPRRPLIAVGLASMAALVAGLATLPWPVGTPTAAAFVSRGLREFGLALTAEGATTMTLLPLPRLSFTRTRITGAQAGGPALIEGGSLDLDLNPLALLSGQADLGSVALGGATIHMPDGADDPRWAEPARRIGARLAQGGTNHPRRITLSGTTLDSANPGAGAQAVDLTLAWPIWSASLDAAATLTWRGARTSVAVVGLRAGDLLAGAASPFALNAAWPTGSLSADGTATTAGGFAMQGRGRVETRSLSETMAWIGGDVALAPFIRTLVLDGRFETAGRTLSFSSLRATLGDDVLEGAGSMSFGEARTAVQATLAADSLNLAPLLGGLMQVFGTAPADDGTAEPARPVALAPLTGGDLDLRISAAESRIGPVLLSDLAASVLVRPGSIEVALNRAGLQGATLKGRVALSAAGADGGETEVKAQGAFDRLDLGSLLLDLGEARWVLGGTQGQFTLESSGRDTADLAAHVAGRAGFTIDGGVLAGIDLVDVLHRNGAIAPGALARRNGRTPFERAAIALRFADGIGEIGEGTLKTASLTGILRGQISLPARSVSARAELGPKAGGDPGRPGLAFEIVGPWDAVRVRAAQKAAEPERRDEGPASLHVPTSVVIPGTARAYAP